MFVEEGNIETKKEIQRLIDNLRSKDYFFFKTTHFRYYYSMFKLSPIFSCIQQPILENSVSFDTNPHAIAASRARFLLPSSLQDPRHSPGPVRARQPTTTSALTFAFWYASSAIALFHAQVLS
jgi:hypothetical protein